MFKGMDLNETEATSHSKMTVQLDKKIKGKKLKDWCMTANCEQSRNSVLPPWTQNEMAVFKQLMVRRCEWSEREYSRKLPAAIRTVNGRSRYEHKKWLKKLGV